MAFYYFFGVIENFYVKINFSALAEPVKNHELAKAEDRGRQSLMSTEVLAAVNEYMLNDGLQPFEARTKCVVYKAIRDSDGHMVQKPHGFLSYRITGKVFSNYALSLVDY